MYLICSSCQYLKINNEWIRQEGIILINSDDSISHGICPACIEKLYGEDFCRSIQNN